MTPSSETNVLLTLVRYPGGSFIETIDQRDKGQYCPLQLRQLYMYIHNKTALYWIKMYSWMRIHFNSIRIRMRILVKKIHECECECEYSNMCIRMHSNANTEYEYPMPVTMYIWRPDGGPGADRRMSPERRSTDEPWTQFDRWALGAILPMSPVIFATIGHSEMASFVANFMVQPIHKSHETDQ